MIPVDDYLEAASSLSEGEQVNINHTACVAGEDTRKRLYVKRVEGELIVAFCHNCQDKGVFLYGHTNVNSYRQAEDKIVYPLASEKPRNLPDGIEFNVSLWPNEAKTWACLHKPRIAAVQMHMAYDYKTRRVIIPFHNHVGEYQGYVSRKIFPDDLYPKYLTYLKSRVDRFYAPPHKINVGLVGTQAVVICEDMVSARALYRAGHTPYCLCGASFNAGEFMADWSGKESAIVVWLDNDNPTVCAISCSILGQLKALYPYIDVRRVRITADPKVYDYTDINKIIEDALS